MAVLGYLTKLTKGLGLVFGAHFLHGFSIKMFFINVHILFPSQDIKQNMLLSSYLGC